jgi:prevent-host-death family protein
MTVNVHEAKTQFSKLLAKVALGEEVIIAKAGKPVARIAPLEPKARRKPGSAKDMITFKPGWDAPMSGEEYEEFLGQ